MWNDSNSKDDRDPFEDPNPFETEDEGYVEIVEFLPPEYQWSFEAVEFIGLVNWDPDQFEGGVFGELEKSEPDHSVRVIFTFKEWPEKLTINVPVAPSMIDRLDDEDVREKILSIASTEATIQAWNRSVQDAVLEDRGEELTRYSLE